MEKQPPIGIMPRWRWVEIRSDEILAAIERYKEHGTLVPEEWIEELDEHQKYLAKFYDRIEQ